MPAARQVAGSVKAVAQFRFRFRDRRCRTLNERFKVREWRFKAPCFRLSDDVIARARCRCRASGRCNDPCPTTVDRRVSSGRRRERGRPFVFSNGHRRRLQWRPHLFHGIRMCLTGHSHGFCVSSSGECVPGALHQVAGNAITVA